MAIRGMGKLTLTFLEVNELLHSASSSMTVHVHPCSYMFTGFNLAQNEVIGQLGMELYKILPDIPNKT
jgi:hypothetical protein